MHHSPKATLLIPTFERSEFLTQQFERLETWLDNSMIRVRVLDGSELQAEANQAACAARPWVEYRRYPADMDVFERIFRAVLTVDTPYVSLLADDDILHPGGYLACLDFLEANPDFQTAAGRFDLVLPDADGQLRPGGTVYESGSWVEESGLSRLRSSLVCSSVALFVFGIQRTPGLAGLAEAVLARGEVLDQIAKELIYACYPALLGKLHRADARFYSRRRGHASARPPRQRHRNQYESDLARSSDMKYVFNPRFSETHQTMKAILAPLVRPEEGSPEYVSDHMDESFFLNLLSRIRHDPAVVTLWKEQTGLDL